MGCARCHRLWQSSASFHWSTCRTGYPISSSSSPFNSNLSQQNPRTAQGHVAGAGQRLEYKMPHMSQGRCSAFPGRTMHVGSTNRAHNVPQDSMNSSTARASLSCPYPLPVAYRLNTRLLHSPPWTAHCCRIRPDDHHVVQRTTAGHAFVDVYC